MSAGLATTLQRTHLDGSSNTTTTASASMSKLSPSGLPVTPTGSISNYPLPSPALSMGSINGSSSSSTGNRASNRHASLRFGESGSQRNTNRYSVTALYSMAAEQDTEIEDELARGVFLHIPFFGYCLERPIILQNARNASFDKAIVLSLCIPARSMAHVLVRGMH